MEDFLESQKIPPQKRHEIEARLRTVSLAEVFPGACAAFVLHQDASLVEAYKALVALEPRETSDNYWGFLIRVVF